MGFRDGGLLEKLGRVVEQNFWSGYSARELEWWSGGMETPSGEDESVQQGGDGREVVWATCRRRCVRGSCGHQPSCSLCYCRLAEGGIEDMWDSGIQN